MKRAFLSRLAAAMAAMAVLVGCAPQVSEPVTITILHGWGTMESDAVAMRAIYADFEQAYPGVEVEQIAMPSTDQALTRVGDQLAVGNIPDVVFLAGTGISLLQYMQKSGAARNLAPYIAQDGAFFSDIAPAVREQWSGADGSIYTLPDVLWQFGLWTNTSLLAEAGVKQPLRTWDDFFAACDVISARAEQTGSGVTPVQIVSNDVPILLKLIMAGESGEGRAMVESGKMDYTSDAFVSALRIVERLAAYSPESAQTYEYRDTLSVFNQGKSAFYINGIWANSLIDESIAASCVAFPGGANGTVALQTALSGYVIGNTGDERRMEASVAFVKYMLSDDVQRRILLETGQYPENPSVDLSAYAAAMPRLMRGAEAISGADVCLTCLVDTYAEDERALLRDCVGRLLAGRLTAEEAGRILADRPVSEETP